MEQLCALFGSRKPLVEQLAPSCRESSIKWHVPGLLEHHVFLRYLATTMYPCDHAVIRVTGGRW